MQALILQLGSYSDANYSFYYYHQELPECVLEAYLNLRVSGLGYGFLCV